MTTPAAPKRRLDALPEGDPLRSALAAAVRDRPKVDFDRVYRSVVAVGGAGLGGEGGGDLATGPTVSGAHAVGSAVGKASTSVLGGGAVAKTLAIGLFGAASVGTAWWIARDAAPPGRNEPPRATPTVQHVASSTAPLAAPPPAARPTAAPSAPTPPVVPPSSPGGVDDGDEMSLLREAGGAIASDPARALALVDEAERRFARSSLGQEREVIRIQALVAAGRREEAAARARALLARTPSSAHRPRLEQILPELAAD